MSDTPFFVDVTEFFAKNSYLCTPYVCECIKIYYNRFIMNVVREHREDLTSLIRVTVGEADYAQEVDKILRDYKRKANIPGFRRGMVPMSIINRMYRKGVVAEQAYKCASNGCFEYLDKEKIEYVGDVLPSDEQKEFDFDNQTEFEFVFEIGEAPAINIELSDKDKLTYYNIEISDKMHENYRSNYLRRFGRLVDVESVERDEALSATLDNGEMRVEDAYVGLISLGDEERKPFVGKKVGDKMQINVNELFKNEAQRAAVLGVKKEELEGVKPEFEMEITKIRRFADPELNEEFFKAAFPDGKVTDEKGLDEYIDAQIGAELKRESEYLFVAQMRNMLLKKADLKLPEAFLKHWLYVINEGKYTEAQIEQDFENFMKMYRWSLIQKHYAKELNLTVSEEEALEEAKALAAMQFAQYGMASAPDDMLTNYGRSILGNKQEAGKIYDKLFETKVVDALRSQIKVTEKSVSAEEFGKIAEATNAQ